MDFSTLCSKRILTQYVIESLETRLANDKELRIAKPGEQQGRVFTAEETLAIREILQRYRAEQSSISEEMANKMKYFHVACAMCYVEAARLKSPKQQERWLGAERAGIITNYLAEEDAEFRKQLKTFEDQWKIEHGYEPNITKEKMRALGDKGKKDWNALYAAKTKMRSEYKLNDEQKAIVERGIALPRNAFLTAANLAELSQREPKIFGAYAKFIRNATKSKGLERDEPYYYGDSYNPFNGKNKVVSDGFIESVNAENGMRFQSWSDWRIVHLLDYITAVCDLSVRGAAMHGYTKFPNEVRAFGKTGIMFNMSGVLQGTGIKEDGTLDFSPTESVDFDEAMRLRDEFPETAGMQCIGISDKVIRLLMDCDFIDYIIPYHKSSLTKRLRKIAQIANWTDYENSQNAKKIPGAKNENNIEKWQTEPEFSEFFVGYDTGMSGIEAMRASAKRYIAMCKERGLTPKFAQFSDHPNYWKLLIDRKMINQKTGELIRQKPVRPDFDFELIRRIVDEEVANSAETMQDEALNYVLDHIGEVPKLIKELVSKGDSSMKMAQDLTKSQSQKNSIGNYPTDEERLAADMIAEEQRSDKNRRMMEQTARKPYDAPVSERKQAGLIEDIMAGNNSDAINARRTDAVRNARSVLAKSKRVNEDVTNKPQAVKDAEQTVVNYFKEQIDRKWMDAMSKLKLNRMLSIFPHLNAKNQVKMMTRAEGLVRDMEIEHLEGNIERMMKLKVQDKNNQGVSVAKTVDDETRQVFKILRDYTKTADARTDGQRV